MKNFIKNSIVIALLLTSTFVAKAQVKIGTNPTTINAGSLLEMESGTKGLLMPRVSLGTTTTWLPLTGIATAGMTVYNTNAAITSTNTAYPVGGAGEYYWDGTGWLSKKATGVNNGLLDQLSFQHPDGSTVQFIIPVDVLVPSAKLKITYSFWTNNNAGASMFRVCTTGTGGTCTDVGDTGPCGTVGTGGYWHKSVTITRPVAPYAGMLLFQILPNAVPGCQTQTLFIPNIVVQPVD